MDGFEFARASLKLDQGVEVAANVDDADAVPAPDEITTGRYISLDEQHSEPFIQRRTFKVFRRKPNVQHAKPFVCSNGQPTILNFRRLQRPSALQLCRYSKSRSSRNASRSFAWKVSFPSFEDRLSETVKSQSAVTPKSYRSANPLTASERLNTWAKYHPRDIP